jgi:hypothetical protein
MKHRRSFRDGRRPNRFAIIVSMVGVFLSGCGFFALRAYADRTGESTARPAEVAAQRHVPDWRGRHSPRPSKTPRKPRPSPTASTPAPKPPVTPSATTTTAPPPPAGGGGGSCALPGYPTPGCTGVPAGWKPQVTRDGDLTVTKAGTVIEDHLVTGSIYVKAPDVTIRNTRVYGTVDNFIGDRIYGKLLIEDTEVVNPPGQEFSKNAQYAFGVANYTCRRCKVVNRMEGWRVGADDYSGAGPVLIEDSFAQLAVPAGMCETADPHGDGIQGYGGPAVTIRHNTIDQRRDDCPTAPVFIPDQGNAGATVQDNLLAGGGYTLRLTGGRFPAVTGNKIVQGSFGYGPLEVACSRIEQWQGNATVTYDWAAGKVTGQVKSLNECG